MLQSINQSINQSITRQPVRALMLLLLKLFTSESTQNRADVTRCWPTPEPSTRAGPIIGSFIRCLSAGHFYLSMTFHVPYRCRCFSALWQLSSIWRQVSTTVFHLLVVALLLTQLDYCNSMMAELLANFIQRRVRTTCYSRAHLEDSMPQLHHRRTSQSWMDANPRTNPLQTCRSTSSLKPQCTTLLVTVLHPCH